MKQKSLLLFIPVLAVILLIGLHMRKQKAHTVTPSVQTVQTLCYERSVDPTSTAPYAVHESVRLTISDDMVSGTKKGTQAGPDMTNGYEGTLTGTKSGDKIDVLYSYTIEGSQQQEREYYTLQGSDLIKERYPLIEQKSVLVPDTTTTPTEEPYHQMPCR